MKYFKAGLVYKSLGTSAMRILFIESSLKLCEQSAFHYKYSCRSVLGRFYLLM
jgi:hypothetical protein